MADVKDEANEAFDADVAAAIAEIEAPSDPTDSQEPAAEEAPPTTEVPETPPAPNEVAEVVKEVPSPEKTDGGGAVPQADGDPLAGTTPFSFNGVDGTPRTIDSILLADGGAIVPPDKLDAFKGMLEATDRVHAQNLKLQQDYGQTVAALDGLSHKIGADEYRGVQAFHALQSDLQATVAGAEQVMGRLLDKEYVIALALAYQGQDQESAKQLLNQVVERAAFTYEKSQFSALRSVEQEHRQQDATRAEGQAESGAIAGKIDEFMNHPDLKPFLTADDRKAAEEHFSKFRTALVRQATAEDALRSNGQIRAGQKIVDGTLMQDWFLRALAFRKQEQASSRATATAAKAAATAGKINASVQQARQPKKASPAKAPAKVPDAPRKSKDAAFHEAFEAAMQDLNIPT